MAEIPGMGSILVNGWFWDRLDTGSGQYVNALMRHWPHAEQGNGPQIHLLVPKHARGNVSLDQENSICGPVLHDANLVNLPPALAKVWWEQITVPYSARKLGANLVWHPYWTASLWQPQPQVTTIHDVIPAILPAYKAATRQKLYLRLVTAATRRTRQIVTVSKASSKDIEEQLGLPRHCISVVSNGVGPHEIPPFSVGESIRRQHNLPARFFLYLGSFERRKNVATLLKAFALFRGKGGDPEMVLVLAGKLPGQDTLVLQDPRPLIEELALGPFVRIFNFPTEEEKAALYELATVFVFPGLYEGFGLMVAEAMRAGTPVITSNH